MIKLLSKEIEYINRGLIYATRLSVLVVLSVCVFGGCGIRAENFENTTEAIESLEKHRIIGCGDMDYLSAGATSGSSCKVEGSSRGFEIYTYENDAYKSCKSFNWCRKYLEESDGKCCKFVGNVLIITYYHSEAGLQLGDSLAQDLVD